MVFVTFGFLNILTGFFVDGTVQASLDSREEIDKRKDLSRSLDMEPSELKDLFGVLDINNTNEVGIDDFVNGCLRVMGPPKSLDICTCLFQNKKILVMMENLMTLFRKIQ